MPANIIKLPSANAVGAGQTATIDVPLGPTYRAIYLRYKQSGTLVNEATMKAQIGDVRVKVNGKPQRTHSVTQLLEMLKVYGISAVTGHVPLLFAEPWRRDALGEDALAWGTADVDTFQIEVDIAGTATAPALEAYAVIDRTRRSLGAIKRVRRFVLSPTAAGDFQFQHLPKQGTSYFAAHLFEGIADNVSNVLAEVDQNKVFDVPSTLLSTVMAHNGLAKQSGIYSVQFDMLSRLTEALPMVRSDGNAARLVSNFMLTLTVGAADNITLVTEELGARF